MSQGAISEVQSSEHTEIGEEIYALAARIFPICRSITGNGVRETLDCLAAHIALDVREVPTGTRVFDWDVPREWTIKDAYIKNEHGHRVARHSVTRRRGVAARLILW